LHQGAALNIVAVTVGRVAAGRGSLNEQPDTSAPAPLIELRGITKAFPGVVALNDVDLTIRSAEVHALTGENGSGKSTLARVINGSVQPDAGTITVDGRRQQVKDPRAALRLGIVTISQELTLAPTLSVAENIFLGRLPRRAGRVDWRLLRRQATEVLDRLDVHVRPTTIVDRLSVEMQQEVEIARAISSNARLLILDEATSSLSEAATQRLLAVVEEQRAAGVAVLMISHRMPELYAAASCATVLRDGHLVGTCRLPETSEQRLVSMMVGRELGDYYGKRELEKGEAILEVTDIATQNGALRPTSLRVHRGEILGVAGLVGSGKAELGMALGGAIPCTGAVRVNGKDVAMGDPRSTLSGGIGFVPDDRKRSAVLPTRSVSENFSIAWNGHLSNKGVLDTRAERRMVRDAITRYGVITASAASRITTLSGGNQQKVVLGRMFALGVEVLVLSEPTRGIDVGAKSEIYRLLNDLAQEGRSIIMISSELPEILRMSHRILVMCEGRVTGELTSAEATQERIMTFATQRAAA
jgi:ABC-type sugar transport system ATPase subunit